jgi:hypothetical protein
MVSEAQLQEAIREAIDALHDAGEDGTGALAAGAGGAEDVRAVGADGGFLAAGFEEIGGGGADGGGEGESHGGEGMKIEDC